MHFNGQWPINWHRWDSFKTLSISRIVLWPRLWHQWGLTFRENNGSKIAAVHIQLIFSSTFTDELLWVQHLFSFGLFPAPITSAFTVYRPVLTSPTWRRHWCSMQWPVYVNMSTDISLVTFPMTVKLHEYNLRIIIYLMEKQQFRQISRFLIKSFLHWLEMVFQA